MAPRPGPGRHVHAEGGMTTSHLETGTYGKRDQGPLDQQVAAAVEAKSLKVDSREQ